MADVPNQTLTVRDPGLGIVAAAPSTFLFMGTSSAGTANAIEFFNTPGQVVDSLGQGPLPEALCTYLAIAGGPAMAIKVDHTGEAGVITNGTAVRAGTSDGTVTISATVASPGPYDHYQGRIEIVTAGDIGAATFRYYLDGDESWSPEIIVPAGGVYTIPNTGLLATFAVGAGPSNPDFDAGDYFPFSTTANHYNTTTLAAAMTVALASNDRFAALVLCGREADTADGATMFAALDVHMTTFFNAYKFARALMDTGIPELSGSDYNFATVKDNWVDAISAKSRVAATFGDLRHITQKPFVGWSNPLMPILYDVAARAGSKNLSSHMGRFADGPLTGVTSIVYDEDKDGQGMSAAKFITTRTWLGQAGKFLNKGHLRSPNGSDFTEFARGQIMDVALAITHSSLQPYMNTKIRVLTDGTGRIDPKHAAQIEGVVNNNLVEALMVPKDAEGNDGHVAGVRYTIDLENNILTTGLVKGSVAIVPDPYAEEISTELGFTAQL